MNVTQQKISGFLVTFFFLNLLILLNWGLIKTGDGPPKINIPGTVSVPDIRTIVTSFQSLKGETFLNFKYYLSSNLSFLCFSLEKKNRNPHNRPLRTNKRAKIAWPCSDTEAGWTETGAADYALLVGWCKGHKTIKGFTCNWTFS